jgi:hypothetical protein
MSTSQQIDDFIRQCFDRNYELLKQESGTSVLTPETRDIALNQVFLYWQKLREIAERITDTEVPIHLPNQTTPKGRSFSIEGVVDVVREDNLTMLYDIKTHNAEYVREHKDLYAMQVNLYAYVWQQLRGQPLDGIAIIATAYTEAIRDTIPAGKLVNELTLEEQDELDDVLVDWHPVVDIDYSELSVKETIQKFGEVVDQIEDGIFAPPPVEVLEAKWQQTNERFTTRICRVCDARFSCNSYYSYAQKNSATNPHLSEFVETFYSDLGDAAQQEGWLASNLNASPEEAYINALLGEG